MVRAFEASLGLGALSLFKEPSVKESLFKALAAHKESQCNALLKLSSKFKFRQGVSRGHLSGPVRDTPPYRAIPFRDSIAEGGIAPTCLVFIGYRASIAEIPLWGGGGGYRTSSSHALQGETLRKGGGGIAPNWPCWDTKNPMARK